MRPSRPLRRVAVASTLLAAFALAGCSTSSGSPDSSTDAGPVELTLATAGDTNMTDLQDTKAIPLFQESHPGAKVTVTNTGAGDAGSVAIAERLAAQSDAGKETWDTDLAIVHQSVMAELIEQDLVEQWVPGSANEALITADNAKNALGTDVSGYVAPLYQSQIAIAYNPEVIPDGFASMADVEEFITENPNRFGYNGVTNGASGVGFTDAWVAWKSGQGDQIFNGPYDQGIESEWGDILGDLKALPAQITNGNNGTLDLLNRGEIDAGPVWVDMYSQWTADGRLNPDIQVSLPKEGLPSQPMYVVIPKQGANKEAALEYADFLTSPDFQASVIVDQMSWYPGIDPEQVYPLVSKEGQEKLFGQITAQQLASSSMPFPLAQYKADIEQLYAAS